MIYVNPGGRHNKKGLGVMIRQFVFRLGRWMMHRSMQGALPVGNVIPLYNLDPQNRAAGFSRETRERLDRAAEDFEAAVAGVSPIHAINQGGLLDGGTTLWQGDGYSITVMKSLTTVGDLSGYMFGPVLRLEYPLAHGNTTEISHVMFYTGAAMAEWLG